MEPDSKISHQIRFPKAVHQMNKEIKALVKKHAQSPTCDIHCISEDKWPWLNMSWKNHQCPLCLNLK